MPHFPAIVLAIAFAAVVVAVTALARRLPVPTPILQVLAGLAVAFIPGVALPEVDPDVVFLVFLPPVLWSAAFFTSLRDFSRNRRPIGLLAIGLVIATSVAVAITARALFPGMSWAVAVALGAIVSPPDAVAATAIVSRLRVPRRVIVILEGESLVNDASALIVYRTAVAAAVTGYFSAGEAVVRFFVDSAMGVLIGMLVAWLVLRAVRFSRDTMAEILLTLAAPYVAWLTAESIHVSAVLACVAGGLYLRRHFSTAVGPLSRLQTRAVWDLVVFVLNAMIFLLLGVEFRVALRTVPSGEIGALARAGLVIGLVAIVVRLLWVPIATLLPRWLSREVRRRDPLPSWKPVFLVAWTSMRGIVSLATALALPLVLATGEPFPYRAQILVITMCVIMLTLVVQGFTLAPMVRAFAFPPEERHHVEARLARLEATRRGAEALDDLAREPWVDQRDVEWLRGELRDRVRLLQHGDAEPEGRRRLRREMLHAERRMLVRLRNEGAISDDVLHELEQELDLESVRIG
ncbi:MAG: Na+/H+ antiporter [Gemmatimonadaceae bacterium]|nr:Na+/H+ antiporter [Gemmatimonadaceae bacterium]NUQ94461.1 Na+/H+ antiporter [Gemmatimonadaceae bacterium]NUR18557.1 Na+/H+ antiporter [Gemmatimonadaceae bacterium]NUS97872.1 Na+/H+ antiporter [Gemmatimonadaceae bacterium]